MAKIYKYQKAIDKFTTYTVVEPDYKEGDERVTELCTIGDITYISVPNTISLSQQPKQITLVEVILTAELKKTIKKVSFHNQLIDQRIHEKIREQYSLQDELEILRKRDKDIAKFVEYDAFVGECCVWGNNEKAKLGL
jgi:hypothetical protein